MADYAFSGALNTPLWVFIPETVREKGSVKRRYPETGELIFCTFRTFGGTERISNDAIVVEDTAVVETWYRPDIRADCRIRDAAGTEYEILGTPENIRNRNRILRFKIRSVKGGA